MLLGVHLSGSSKDAVFVFILIRSQFNFMTCNYLLYWYTQGTFKCFIVIIFLVERVGRLPDRPWFRIAQPGIR